MSVADVERSREKKIFPTLIGNDPLRSRLGEDILSSSLSHAYIIDGKKGSGKHTAAMLIAASLSCENKDSPHHALPCGECPSCKKILSGKSPDVILVKRDDKKSSITVDTVRELKNSVIITPNDTEYKVYIIEDADTMNVQAQNAFLLTLEEPPKYVLFLLLCENSGLLLETVRSRAATLRTEPTDREKISEYLLNRCDNSEVRERANELKRTSPEEFSKLLLLSDSSIGQAVDLLDEKTRNPILKNREFASELILAMSDRRGAEKLLALIATASGKREETVEQLTLTQKALRDMTLIKRSDTAPMIFFTSREEAASFASSFTLPDLMFAYDAIAETKSSLSGNANVRLTLIKFAVKIKTRNNKGN